MLKSPPTQRRWTVHSARTRQRTSRCRETRRLRNSLDGGGRHDIGTHHGVRQLIPQRGPTIRSGPSPVSHRPRTPAPGSPARRAAANSRPDSFRLVTVPDVRGPGRAGDPTPESPCRPYGSARRGAGRCRRNVPSPAAALGLRWPDLEPGRTRTDDLPLKGPPLAAHQPLPGTTVHRDAAQDAVGIPVRRQFVSQTVSQAIKLLGARVVLRCAPGWSLRVGGRVRGNPVEYAMEAPEVLRGGDVAGEGGRYGGGAGVAVGRRRGEGAVSGGDAF